MIHKILLKLKQKKGNYLIFMAVTLMMFFPLLAVIYDFHNIRIMQNDLKNVQDVALLSCVAGAKNTFNANACVERIKETIECNKSGSCTQYEATNSNENKQQANGRFDGTSYFSSTMKFRQSYEPDPEYGQNGILFIRENGLVRTVSIRLRGQYKPALSYFLKLSGDSFWARLVGSNRPIRARDASSASAIYLTSQ